MDLRSFLTALEDQAPGQQAIPRVLYVFARQEVGSVAPDAVEDLVADLLLDLLERRGQAGSIRQLLLLDERSLLGAIRRRLVQVRARQHGTRSQVVKSLRAHVRAVLISELPPPGGLPVSLTVGDRLCAKRVRQAVAQVLASADAPAREPRAIAGLLWSIFFEGRHHDIREQAHGQADDGHEDVVLARADASRHADQLRQQLGPSLTQVILQRVKGLSLAQVAAGRTGASTIHDRQSKAVGTIRAHVERYGLVREDLEPALAMIAA
jgi:hypothetical protein